MSGRIAETCSGSFQQARRNVTAVDCSAPQDGVEDLSRLTDLSRFVFNGAKDN
jgi:hypothetical protein